MSNQTTQSFDHLPTDAYYVSNSKYSGLSNIANYNRNNMVTLGSIAVIKQLKK